MASNFDIQHEKRGWLERRLGKLLPEIVVLSPHAKDNRRVRKVLKNHAYEQVERVARHRIFVRADCKDEAEHTTDASSEQEQPSPD